jgi:hypothetical protein
MLAVHLVINFDPGNIAALVRYQGSLNQQPFTYGSLPGKRDFFFVAGK